MIIFCESNTVLHLHPGGSWVYRTGWNDGLVSAYTLEHFLRLNDRISQLAEHAKNLTPEYKDEIAEANNFMQATFRFQNKSPVVCVTLLCVLFHQDGKQEQHTISQPWHSN